LFFEHWQQVASATRELSRQNQGIFSLDTSLYAGMAKVDSFMINKGYVIPGRRESSAMYPK
jgi:hypothetical protein